MRLVAILGMMVAGASMVIGAVASMDGDNHYVAGKVIDFGTFVVVFALVLMTLELSGSAVLAFLKERRERKTQTE